MLVYCCIALGHSGYWSCPWIYNIRKQRQCISLWSLCGQNSQFVDNRNLPSQEDRMSDLTTHLWQLLGQLPQEIATWTISTQRILLQTISTWNIFPRQFHPWNLQLMTTSPIRNFGTVLGPVRGYFSGTNRKNRPEKKTSMSSWCLVALWYNNCFVVKLSNKNSDV